MKPSFEADNFCYPKSSLNAKYLVNLKRLLGFALLYPAYGPFAQLHVANRTFSLVLSGHLFGKMQKSNFLYFKECDLDRYIYRIVSIKRLIELYKNKENTLVKPDTWDDPYENFILKSKVRTASGEIRNYGFHTHFYGQCWSLHKASDAMWRIYSKDKCGVRIRTTVRKLANSLSRSGVKLPEATCYIGKVRYLTSKDLKDYSNSAYLVYEDSSFAVDSLFKSLLVFNCVN